MKKCHKALLYIFSALGVVCVVVAAVLYFLSEKNDLLQGASLAIGLFGTVVSIVLSIVATICSFKSSAKMENLVQEVKEQYATYVKEIKDNKIQQSFGATSAKQLLKKDSKDEL